MALEGVSLGPQLSEVIPLCSNVTANTAQAGVAVKGSRKSHKKGKG